MDTSRERKSFLQAQSIIVYRIIQEHILPFHGPARAGDDDDEVMLNVLRCQLTY